ncbi:TetR/AcrR family transcriptional regulator [Streptomyces sp. NPDC019531]|uniref:TetR/AcrR family transcriptional regulator n=1 Tax=Streptomyces sp. NPDC019531 TaxID=3365062 RepID=UPI00384D6635
MIEQTAGRRERKKAATRQALADAALDLFLERGFDGVGVKEIAEAADVSVTTLFKHFPSKEALVFDRQGANEAALAAAVRHRLPGQSVLDALHLHLRSMLLGLPNSTPGLARFLTLVDSTPALREYARRMWLGQEEVLSAVIAEELGCAADDMKVRALARFALESRLLARDSADPLSSLDAVFDLLARGWGEFLEPSRVDKAAGA